MSCFHLSKGTLGNKNGSWFLGLVGLMEGALLVWSEFAKGFSTGVLGRTANIQVVTNGSQQLLITYFVITNLNWSLTLFRFNHGCI
jgi:hypothetical protein